MLSSELAAHDSGPEQEILSLMQEAFMCQGLYFPAL